MNNKLGISVSEMARRLGISTPTAYTWAHRADFPSFCIGNRIVVYEKGLEEWVKKMVESKAA
ncbi:MAG: helix-turn-helix domain-containing protein [Clostridiales bacterium]|nr:helix-turn-helix domain-containing protein [Clostridiales bacterium]